MTTKMMNAVQTIPVANLRPLPLARAMLLFAVPAGLMVLSVFGFRPLLLAAGEPPLEAFAAAHIVPTALLFAAALIAYHHWEGRPLTWTALGERFRYPRLSVRAILQGIGLFGLLMLGYGIFAQLGAALQANGLMPLPGDLPALLDPGLSAGQALREMAGGSLLGRWDLVILFFVMLAFNIIGEEFWWRGYILPRQELTHGKRTWLIHGLLWTAFHAFKYWQLIGLLPVCLTLAYAAQRLRNNWPVLIAHTLFNGLILILLVQAVLGLA